MKFLKIFFIIVFVLIIVVAAGLFIFLKTFDINRVMPQITSQVSAQLGKEVAVGRTDLALSLSKGISLNARDIVVHQDRSRSSEKIVEIQNVKMALDVMTLLRERKIRVMGVQVISPRLKLVRNKDGSFNVLPAPAAVPPTPGRHPPRSYPPDARAPSAGRAL